MSIFRFITKQLLLMLFIMLPLRMAAQIGEHRNDLAIGVNGGLTMSSVGFTPKVTQGQLLGPTMGFTMRYTCEKYFKTIASVVFEVNYAQLGWNENIVDLHTQPVINPLTGMAEKYSRKIGYIQVPFLANLAWGKEDKGMRFFIQAGPQFGYKFSEKTITNFDITQPNLTDRANKTNAQYNMDVEKPFDYGISAGLGVELSNPVVGHIAVEGRYYYGLGNIYGSTKRDYFAKSNHSAIELKLSYLFDITKTSH